MKKAFTLVELLVVVGILAILIGVLLNVFGGAGDSARAAKCQTNLRNLGMAAQSYGMEHGKYPVTWISYSTDAKEGGAYISPYAGSTEEREFSLTNGLIWKAIGKSRESYVCPTHQRYAREHNLGKDPLWSYVMNSGAGGSGYGDFNRADATLLFAELPFAEVANGDFKQSGQISGDMLDPMLDARGNGDEDEEKKKGNSEVIGFNHKQGKNLFAHICYADGHVAKLIAPKVGDAVDLTSWLCYPSTSAEAGKSDIDISFDGTKYKKIIAE